jgi:hypothetical protein
MRLIKADHVSIGYEVYLTFNRNLSAYEQPELCAQRIFEKSAISLLSVDNTCTRKTSEVPTRSSAAAFRNIGWYARTHDR